MVNNHLIYASPLGVRPNQNRKHNESESKLNLYSYKFTTESGGGMILVAAENEEDAIKLVKKRLNPIEVNFDKLELIYFCTCSSGPGIKGQYFYSE